MTTSKGAAAKPSSPPDPPLTEGVRGGGALPRPRGRRAGRRTGGPYPSWFYLPAIALYVVFFAVPTFASFYFSLTRWSLFDATFIGFGNFVQFFQNPQLFNSFFHTFAYAFSTSAAKVVLGMALGLLLTSAVVGRGYLRAVIFFPAIVSTIGVDFLFKSMLDPFHGVVNAALGAVGLPQPGWFTDPALALWSIAAVDVWKGVGIATLIFMAGIVAIPQDYYEAARIDGASSWRLFWSITLPLSRPAIATVIILSLIGGLRSFDIIWATTNGGPGFASDVIASVIYKQYQAGFFGLSTAGNVVLFLVVAAIMIPISRLLNRREVEL